MTGGKRQMRDSGLTGFLYNGAPDAPTAQYKNPVNLESHIWRAPSSNESTHL